MGGIPTGSPKPGGIGFGDSGTKGAAMLKGLDTVVALALMNGLGGADPAGAAGMLNGDAENARSAPALLTGFFGAAKGESCTSIGWLNGEGWKSLVSSSTGACAGGLWKGDGIANGEAAGAGAAFPGAARPGSRLAIF